MQEIYKLTPQMLQDDEYFAHMVANMDNNYYWSDDWSEEFYIALAKKGFIATSYDTPEGLILLPELQFAYAILEFENLHISKKVAKLLGKKECYSFGINTQLSEVLSSLAKYHKHNWLKGRYVELMENLFQNNGKHKNFKLISVTLNDAQTGALVAGEVGYIIGKTYTSLSGFSDKNYANYGTLQMVLLAQHLQEKGFDFWNMGHPYMEYKKKLGCCVLERKEFLERWVASTQERV